MSNFDRQRVTQYMNFIKQANYEYSKDSLGFYFDNGVKKFSVLKTGPTFNCFYNKLTDKGWVLKDRKVGFIDFASCLHWVLIGIQKAD